MWFLTLGRDWETTHSEAAKTAAEQSPGMLPMAERGRLRWTGRQRRGLKYTQMTNGGSGREEEEEKGGVKAAYSHQMANDKQAAGFVCYHIIFCFLLVIEISIKRFLCNFRCENPLGEKNQTM